MPFKYKSDISRINEKCNEFLQKYHEYYNYITNYILSSKLKYLEDNSLNYLDVAKDFRNNSFLENYNRYINEKLGKQRQVNWVNFINFIKDVVKYTFNKIFKAISKELFIFILKSLVIIFINF